MHHLRAGFGVRKATTGTLQIQMLPLQRIDFGMTATRQYKQPDRYDNGRRLDPKPFGLSQG
jgi:hypothetical protein